MSDRNPPKPLSSLPPTDHCSGVPDFTFGEHCKLHDEDYENGGSLLDKWKADARFAWRIATTPRPSGREIVALENRGDDLRRLLKCPGLTLKRRGEIVDELEGVNEKIERARVMHHVHGVGFRAVHLGAAALYGAGVVVIHPVYKLWGAINGKRVGFNYGRRRGFIIIDLNTFGIRSIGRMLVLAVILGIFAIYCVRVGLARGRALQRAIDSEKEWSESFE